MAPFCLIMAWLLLAFPGSSWLHAYVSLHCRSLFWLESVIAFNSHPCFHISIFPSPVAAYRFALRLLVAGLWRHDAVTGRNRSDARQATSYKVRPLIGGAMRSQDEPFYGRIQMGLCWRFCTNWGMGLDGRGMSFADLEGCFLLI